MIWPFKRRRAPRASNEALTFRAETERELEDVRNLRTQARDVGESLRQRHKTNHFGPALEAVIRGGNA